MRVFRGSLLLVCALCAFAGAGSVDVGLNLPRHDGHDAALSDPIGCTRPAVAEPDTAIVAEPSGRTTRPHVEPNQKEAL
jgi:hypothetical protein